MSRRSMWFAVLRRQDEREVVPSHRRGVEPGAPWARTSDTSDDRNARAAFSPDALPPRAADAALPSR